jgi:hypothetical protein
VQKNPTGDPHGFNLYSFSEFISLESKTVKKKNRAKWATAERGRVAEVENGPGAVLVGYLFDAKYSVAESCNCFRPESDWLD